VGSPAVWERFERLHGVEESTTHPASVGGEGRGDRSPATGSVQKPGFGLVDGCALERTRCETVNHGALAHGVDKGSEG